MKRVIILGAGGHGQVVADILLAMNAGEANLAILGFVDDDDRLRGQKLLGLPVLGPVNSLPEHSPDAVVVAVGDNAARARLASRITDGGLRLFSAIHPRSVLGTDVEIGAGSMVCAGVVVNTGVRLGAGVILNTGCTVDHHGKISPFCHIAPGTHLGGEVILGNGTLIGLGAMVLPRVRIGAQVVVGAGAVVTADVPDGCTVVGMPARPLVRQEG